MPERWRPRSLGGKGLGARYRYEALSAGDDPLGRRTGCCSRSGPLSGLLAGETPASDGPFGEPVGDPNSPDPHSAAPDS